MSLSSRPGKFGIALLSIVIMLGFQTTLHAASSNKRAEPVKLLKGFSDLSKESAQCVSCHREKSPGIYAMWGESKHYRDNVGCYE